MRTIYVDSNHRCHVTDDGTRIPCELDFFDGRCDAFVEGYCHDPGKGTVYPWKPLRELDAAQAQYEAMLPEILDMHTALNTLGVSIDG